MEQSNHSTPGNAISKDIPGHLHEDVLSTVALNLVDQSEGNKGNNWNGLRRELNTQYQVEN